MEKLEKPKKKHDHLLTKILKFSIFAFIMLAPFISVISKVCYVSFNKNAKDSYYGETINESELVNINSANLKTSINYYFIKNNLTDYNNSFLVRIYVDSLKINENNINNIGYIAIDKQYLSCYTIDNTWINEFKFSTTPITAFFEYSYIRSISGDYSEINNNLYEITYNKYSYLDNAMSYGINELQNDNLYNWSKNTGIYNAILGMTEGLGANNTIAMLLAYWSIITAIYIVFDIVIELFIKLTHLLN